MRLFSIGYENYKVVSDWVKLMGLSNLIDHLEDLVMLIFKHQTNVLCVGINTSAIITLKLLNSFEISNEMFTFRFCNVSHRPIIQLSFMGFSIWGSTLKIWFLLFEWLNLNQFKSHAPLCFKHTRNIKFTFQLFFQLPRDHLPELE